MGNHKNPDCSMFGSAIQTKPVFREQNAAPKIINTCKESNDRQRDLWRKNADVIAGLAFCATMQLRTPLRVLVRHGEVHRDMNSPPPQIANELWEGIWLVKTKTWKELGGADIPDFMATTIASDIGPIPNDGKNLEFLIAVRTVVEAPASIDSRIEQLREVAAQAEWQDFVGRNGGISSIIERFFPYFIATIPTLSPNARDKLYHMRLNTPEKLSTVSDETLLSIKGIGPAKLRIIREYCNSIEHNRDVEMVDQVVR